MSDVPPLSQETIFAEALALPVGERRAYVDKACAGNGVMAARVVWLLRGYEENSGFLETPAASALGPVFESALAADAAEAAGARIGPYKLLQEIGEGGFGTVWMAEQQEPIRRRVALKIIKLGMDTREVIARFEAERQALALMDHPNIARVFDAGATEGGRPYFAMELVRGVPITRYCDENRLAPGARLQLFIAVCHAVQHAHQKGVIHRDLKPSNILVTMHDGVPVPKVIDFGIAKATSAHLTDKTLFTQFHAFIGTPAYTSPEQMEMSGLDVDTRSDIYSLGVLLYELLTGRPPFDPDALAKSGLEAMRRTIREVDPPRPSARLATLSQADRTSVAHERGIEAAKLSLLLRGDLDWVVMHALEKDRTRRYDTPAALAADVQRHLASEPVLARPPSSAYRLRKFIRRHRVGFFAAIAVAVSLVAGLIASSVLLIRETAARQRAVAAEQAEGDLRLQTEIGRLDEIKRAARTALDLANRNLADGRVTDGLAYLVYAARKDPLNPTLAPRIASALTSYNFMLPGGVPFECHSRVLAVRYSNDGRSIFVGTEDGTFRVLDAATGELRREFHVGREVSLDGWEFARDNETVVGVRFPDNTFALFDVASGHAKIAPLQLDPQVWQAPDVLGFGDAVGLSPDGRWIYALSGSEFWVWNAASGEVRLDFKSDGLINSSDFRSDSGRIALTAGTSVRQWSLPDGLPVPVSITFERPPRPGAGGPALRSGVRYSRDGGQLAVCDATVGIHVFDAATGVKLRTLTPNDPFLVPSLFAYTSTDQVFVTGNRATGLWNLTTGTSIPVPGPVGDSVLEVSFAAGSGRGLTISDDGLLRIFDLTTGGLVTEPGAPKRSAFCAALSPDGTQLVVGMGSGAVNQSRIGRGRARPLVLPRILRPAMPAPFLEEAPNRLLWLTGDAAKVIDVASGREVAGGFAYPDSILQPSAQDSKSPVRSDLRFMVVRTRTGGWQSWELGAAGITHAVVLRDAPSRSGVVVFSPSGDRVALVHEAVRVWDLRTGEPSGPLFTYPTGIVYVGVNFSPDGRHLAFGTADGATRILDIATARPITTFATRPLVPNNRVLFSPDGTRVLTASVRGEARLWHAATGEPINPVTYILGSGGQAIFSPDGRWLALWGENMTALWDGRTGVAIGKPIPAGGRHVRFSADGAWLGTGGENGSAHVWHVPSGEAVTEAMPHQPPRAFLPEFSPDGRFLKTENTNFYLWSLPPRPAEGAAPPEWLLQLATVCATKMVDDNGQLVAADEAGISIVELRRQIATMSADAPYAEWGRWILDDRADRPIAPGFTITPDEAAAVTVRFAAAAATVKP